MQLHALFGHHGFSVSSILPAVPVLEIVVKCGECDTTAKIPVDRMTCPFCFSRLPPPPGAGSLVTKAGSPRPARGKHFIVLDEVAA